MLLALALVASAAPAPEIIGWDFTVEDGGWSPGGDIGTTWQWGVIDSGPGAGLGGASGWGTILAGDYLNDAVETLTLPPLDTSGLSQPALGLTHWYAVSAAGDGDLGRVEVWDGAAWALLEPVYGYPTPGGFQGASGEWTTHWFDLTGLGPTVELRLALDSDLAVVDDGWYLGAASLVDGDAVPPQISVLAAPRDTQELESGEVVTVEMVDDRAGVSGRVAWVDDGGGAGEVDLVPQGDGAWSATLPPQLPDTVVTWLVLATDGENEAATPADSYRTYLAAPEDLSGPDQPVAASSATLTWSAPSSPYPVMGYAVLREDEVVVETPSTTARVPLVDGRPRFRVQARFDTPLGELEGDASAAVAIDAAVPVLSPPSPASAWAGDRMRVEVFGENLLLAQDQVGMDLGEGVAVTALSVRDVTTLVAEITVDLDAATGERDLRLTTPTETLTLPGAFRVLAAADRPRVVSMRPDHLSRGERGVLSLETTGGLASEEPAVWLGPGVVIEDLVVTGDQVAVRVAVADDAPLGLRPVEVDDGVRVLSGTDFEVRRPAATVQRACTAASAGGGPLLALLALLGALGRQRARRGPASRVKSRSTKP